MAKVIKDFKERFHNYKKYVVGDEYPENDKERVAFLVDKGFLHAEEMVDKEPKTRQRKKKDVDTDADSDA